MRSIRPGSHRKVLDANGRVRNGTIVTVTAQDDVTVRIGRGGTPFSATVDPAKPGRLTGSVPDPGLVLLQSALLYVDAASGVSGSQTLANLGTGGSALDLQMGSTSGSDTNDPLLLTHTGTDYLYLPSGSSIGCTAPGTATGYKAYPLGGGAATTGSATGGAAFTFNTVGSWTHVDLVDAGDDVVASFTPTDLTSAVTTDEYAVEWTVTRPATGAKMALVRAQQFHFAVDDWMELADTPVLDFGADDDFTVLMAYRFWGTPSADPGALIGKRFAPGQQNGWVLSNGGGGSEFEAVMQVAGDVTTHHAYSSVRTAGEFVVSTGIRRAAEMLVESYTNLDGPGSKWGTVGVAEGDTANDKRFVIGHSDWPGSGFQFEGEFYVAAVFDVALTEEELATVVTYLQGRFDL